MTEKKESTSTDWGTWWIGGLTVAICFLIALSALAMGGCDPIPEKTESNGFRYIKDKKSGYCFVVDGHGQYRAMAGPVNCGKVGLDPAAALAAKSKEWKPKKK